MINKTTTLSLTALITIAAFSCKAIEDAIDCAGESLFVRIDHQEDPQDSLTVNFVVDYTGDYELRNEVEWNFGDGNTIATTADTASHAYASAGTYEVRAQVLLIVDGDNCRPEVIKSIVVD